MTPYERVVAERLQAEAVTIALPPRQQWTPKPRRRGMVVPAIAAIAVLLTVATLAALGSTAGDVPRALATLRTLVRPQAQTVPASWNVFVSEGLLLAIPPEFGAPRPMARLPTFLGPGAPTLLRQVDFDRGLGILVWKGTVRTLLDDFWLKGQQQYSRRPLRAPVSGEEVVTTSVGQSDPVGGRPSGTDQSRSLFIQLAPDAIAHIHLGPTSTAAAPGTATTISAADRALQDQIAAHLRAAPDTDKKIERAEVETIVRRVVGQLQNTALPPGDPNVVRVFSGEQWVYNWPTSSTSFAYIVIYPDRAARERDTGERIADWISPVVQRGVGNVLVLVGSDDANLRYRVIAALDELAN